MKTPKDITYTLDEATDIAKQLSDKLGVAMLGKQSTWRVTPAKPTSSADKLRHQHTINAVFENGYIELRLPATER